MNALTFERCCECDDYTERAGKGDGSLYPTLVSGQELGPLCWDCFDELRSYGLVLED